nr:efflux RND transporter permease subunit [Vibrio nigripulchritudo]
MDGVEYVYSASMENKAQVIVRFYVGENRENALVKLYNKLYSNQDTIPASVSNWAVKPVEIDDVPIVVAALYSTDPDEIGTYELRRIATQATQRLNSLDDTNIVKVTGGQSRVVEVALDASAMASRKTTIDDLQRAFNVSHAKQSAGYLHQQEEVFLLESGQFFQNAHELSQLVVNVIDGKPVYLGDVATITDGPEEASTDTWIQYGHGDFQSYPSVFYLRSKTKWFKRRRCCRRSA